MIDIIRANQTITPASYIGSPLTAALFNHLIIFISYLLLCFYVSPAFENKDERASNTLFVFTFIAVCFIVGIVNMYFAALLAIKILVLFFNRNRQNKENALYYETGLLTALWILIMVDEEFKKYKDYNRGYAITAAG